MILGIETSTRRASLALLDPAMGGVVEEAVFETERAHNAAIFAPFTKMLNSFREQITGVAVGLGPGSYGGIRVGLAVANGFCLVRDLPMVGVSSLIAWEVEAEDFHIIGDARRSTFFLANVRGRRLTGEPDLFTAGELEARLEGLRHEGFPLRTADATVAERFEGVAVGYPSASRVAAVADLAAADSARSLEPVYLRAPYITVPKKSR